MNFHLADWYVDVNANRIHNDEQNIKLESKVMALLVYLAQHPGEVVSRDQLEANVWSGRVISYDALTSCITRLRKVLGDDSRQPVYIETVPKKGYRLIAPVRRAEAEQPSSVMSPARGPAGETVTQTTTGETGRDTSSKKNIRMVFTLVLVLIIAATGIVIMQTMPKVADDIGEISDSPSIVVLPFDNLSNQPGQSYFSDGITADISIALSKLSGLQVIAPPSMLAENSEAENRITASNQQLARYILTGNVQRAGKQLRVNVLLVDSHTHHQLWAESYDREIIAVFDVQDDITAKIVTALSIKLTEEEKKRVAHRYTSSIDAYDQFLRGQALYTKHSRYEILPAREHLLQAIQLDPNFSRAYSTLALTYVDEYRYRWFNSTKDSLLKTLQLAEKAVTIDNRLPQAHWALAYAQLHLHRFGQAKESAANALAVKPNYADGYAILALINIYQGDAEDGIKMIRQAMRLNPDHPAQYSSVLGQAYYYLGDYESALTALQAAIDKNFSLLTAHIMLTATLSQSGLADEANWAAGQLHSIAPDFTSKDVARVFPVKNNAVLQELTSQLAMAGIR